jgi:hypothetical protein|nr:MAG TPA: hypothetical protein [Caudoviricetes sp.]
MPSENKTPHYGLNQWQGNEYPMREDFNRDNALIDAAMGDHEANSIVHITPAEREKWNRVSNPNILHNWDFRNPVNRRGQSSYTGANIYSIDRWHTGNASLTVQVASGYIGVTGGDWFSQIINGNFLYGKTLTFSVMLYDGTIVSGTGVLPIESISWDFVEVASVNNISLVLQNYDGKHLQAGIINATGDQIQLVAAKLELGSVSTIEKDSPADFNEQLLLCQSVTDEGRYTRGFGSNPNLLHNWDFRNPVNQRGLLSYATEEYTIDRWALFGSTGWSGTVTIDSGYLQFDVTTANVYFFQKYEKFIPGTYTLSANIDGTIYSGAVIWDGSTWVSTLLSNGVKMTIESDGVYARTTIIFESNGTFKLYAVKVEKGSVSTLANDPPADYGEQLALCQRYLVPIKKFDFFLARMQRPDDLDFMVPCPVPIRTTPTIVNPAFKIMAGNAVITNATFRVATEGHDLNQVRVRATKTAHGISELAVIEATDNVFLDAGL